jgi:hypothetical protein
VGNSELVTCGDSCEPCVEVLADKLPGSVCADDAKLKAVGLDILGFESRKSVQEISSAEYWKDKYLGKN